MRDLLEDPPAREGSGMLPRIPGKPFPVFFPEDGGAVPGGSGAGGIGPAESGEGRGREGDGGGGAPEAPGQHGKGAAGSGRADSGLGISPGNWESPQGLSSRAGNVLEWSKRDFPRGGRASLGMLPGNSHSSQPRFVNFLRDFGIIRIKVGAG